jgi:uncharacterized protein GlcG (DUF336 family)
VQRLSNNKIRTATMSALTLKVALNLAAKALSIGRQINACAADGGGTRFSGGHLLALQREDGASLLRPSIAIGKAWGAIALGQGLAFAGAGRAAAPGVFCGTQWHGPE